MQAVDLAHPPGDAVQQLQADLRLVLDQRHERAAEQPEHLHRRLGDHRGRPRPAVDRGELPEEVARHHRPDPLLAAHDLALPGQDDEQRLARVAFANDRFARPEREDVGLGREAVAGGASRSRRTSARPPAPSRSAVCVRRRRLLGPPVTASGGLTPRTHHVRQALAHGASLPCARRSGRQPRGVFAGRTLRTAARVDPWMPPPDCARCSTNASSCWTAHGACCCRAEASPKRSSAATGSPTTPRTSRATPIC